MGSGVCDHHPNLGILCLPFHHPDNRAVKHHWRGLRFESAPFSKRLTAENTLYVSYSKSVLSHVEVLNAGQGRWRGRLNVTSAIETWGVPPVMEYIKVYLFCFASVHFFSVLFSLVLFVWFCSLQHSFLQGGELGVQWDQCDNAWIWGNHQLCQHHRKSRLRGFPELNAWRYHSGAQHHNQQHGRWGQASCP